MLYSSSIGMVKRMVKSESLIVGDTWSRLFLDNLDKDIDAYQERRQSIIIGALAVVPFNLVFCTNQIKKLNLLHVSNIIVNLRTKPQTIDLYMSKIILDEEIYYTSYYEIENTPIVSEQITKLMSILDSQIISKEREEKIDRIIK